MTVLDSRPRPAAAVRPPPIPSAPPLVAWVHAPREELPHLPGLVAAMARTLAQASTRIECTVAPEDVPGARAIVEAAAREAGLAVPWSVVAAAGAPGATLRQCLDRHPGHDVAIVSPRAGLPFAWDARLRKAAYAAPRIGAAVPMCDLSPTFELFSEATRRELTIDPEAADRAAFCLGDRAYYEVPRLHAACAYLRREALDEVLAQAGGGDGPGALVDALYRPLRAAGWTPVICDFLYVTHAGAPPAPGEPPDAWEEAAWRDRNPLALLRRFVREAMCQGPIPMTAPGLDARPVQLHVMHYWGGGLDKWVREFSRADSRANLLFASMGTGHDQGQRLVLFGDADAKIPLRIWDLARPIRSTAVASVEYRRILEQVIREFEVDAIVVSSLIGHALDALEMPRPTVVVCHDFYPVCQAINPWFGRACERCDDPDLARCAEGNPLNRTFTDQTPGEWSRMRGRYVSLLADKQLVVPSPSVARTLRALAPALAPREIRVVPHGIDLDAPRLPPPPLAAGERLRLVVLGRLNPQKGLDLLREAAAGLSEVADVALVGCDKPGVELAALHGWRAIERFEPGALPGLLASIAPHAGLLVSVIPETFSYTLSELQALGIPPVATAHGSFADRITDGEDGFLFAPDAASLVARVRALRDDPAALARVAASLARAPRPRSTADMVADYHQLLPLADRPVARFAVGVGQHNGLTESYRHLKDAYGEMGQAYAATAQAYEQTREAYGRLQGAYEHTRAEWERMQAKLERVAAEFAAYDREVSSLQAQRRWWLLPRAVDLARRFQRRMRELLD